MQTAECRHLLFTCGGISFRRRRRRQQPRQQSVLRMVKKGAELSFGAIAELRRSLALRACFCFCLCFCGLWRRVAERRIIFSVQQGGRSRQATSSIFTGEMRWLPRRQWGVRWSESCRENTCYNLGDDRNWGTVDKCKIG